MREWESDCEIEWESEWGFIFNNLKNVTRGHGRSKDSQIVVKKSKKLSQTARDMAKNYINTPIRTLMNAIFCMFTHLIYKNMIFFAK